MHTLSARGTMAATSASFFTLGMLDAALGPALPGLAARTSSSLAAIGAVFTALFLGGLVAQLAAGPLNDRFGQRPVLLVGLALMALGITGLTLSRTLVLALVCMVIGGLGHGALVISINVLIAEVFAERSAAALNLLNLFFGLGAFAGPAAAGLTLRVWGSALPALWLGTGLLLLQLGFLPRLALPARAAQDGPAAPRAGAVLGSPLIWALGALLLLYVGAETGMGGWTTAYLERTTPIGPTSAALAAAGFWLALTIGRVAGAILGARVPAPALLLGSLAGALASAALLAASPGASAPTIAAVLLLGLSFGPIFPTALSIVTGTFRNAPGTAASVVVALGSVGGMLLPWLQGTLLERRGPTASVLLVAAAALAMLAIEIARQLLARPRPVARPPQPAGACD